MRLEQSAWLEGLAIATLTIGIVCAVAIAVDTANGHRQRMNVMNVVWPLTGLYAGPFALWGYWRNRAAAAGTSGSMAGTEPGDQREKISRSNVALAVTHCGAGCTLGDIIGEVVIALIGLEILGSTRGTALGFDFLLAFILGIGFQYWSIVPMQHLTPLEGIGAALRADVLSITAFELGMIVWMVLVVQVIFSNSPEPNDPAFWFMMQIAMLVGFAASLPVNYFLLQVGWKERMEEGS